MELFIINRYVGNNPANGSPSEEGELRKKLLKKIKQRKKLNDLSEKNENHSESKKRKLKDTKEELPGIDNVNGNINIPESEDGKNVRKLKKKAKAKVKGKRKSDENLAPKNEDVNENEIESEKIEENKIQENDNQNTGFLVLGNVHVSKTEKIKRKLPSWLANPSVISVDLKNLSCTIDSIPELDKIFINKLKENNISHFFPVQSQIIPWLLRNADRPQMYRQNDICVSAPTGSGKSLAFVLPILQCLYKRIVPKVRALIVLPVQELAHQVYNVFKTYSSVTDLKILLLSKNIHSKKEQFLIHKNDKTGKCETLVDIIVTTPGCLVEYLINKSLCLDDLKYLVIDEADRVMENMQNDWLYHLNKYLTTECTKAYQVPIISYESMTKNRNFVRKLLFSATLSQDPEKLQQLGLFQPKLFTSVVKSDLDTKAETQFIGKYTTPAELSEYFICCTKMNKPLILHHLVSTKSWKNVLCFANSVAAVSRLTFVLKILCKKNIKIAKLTASSTIEKRNFVLKKFYNGDIDVLISSDALARGIDIPNVKYVISYDVPKFIKTYIHRIGRTGRAGKEGTSVVFLTSKETNHFQKMIQTAGKTSVQQLIINGEELTQYQKRYDRALKSLENHLENKLQKTILRSKTKKMIKLKASKGILVRKSKKSKQKTVKKFKNKK